MLKNLKLYYLFVSMPFVLLIIGSAMFFDAIKSTITRNPHPQINYAIFAIILFGGIFIILNARRLLREARTLVEFSGAIRAKTDSSTLQQMANGYTEDVACLLQMVAASGSRSISHQEQAAIEHELTNARARLNRRNALPQYLTGLLVGMGLLGTFIGLLATLNDISVLISSFADLDMQNVDPIMVFRTMIERMKAPMQSMGIAFSASMFGLLGSITLGLMMVGIRRLQGDIFSLLSSEVARHIEIALSYEDITSTSGAGYSGDEHKVLVRIEERIAEAARLQQRLLSAEIDDLKSQRADMLRTLAENTEASKNFQNDLQHFFRQFGSILEAIEKGNREVCAQLAEVTVHLAADSRHSQNLISVVEKSSGDMCTQISDLTCKIVEHANSSHKLIETQVEEQKKLSLMVDSLKIEERLAELARTHNRILTSEVNDFQKQRADMLQTLSDTTKASDNFRYELQKVGSQLSSLSNVLDKGNEEMRAQVSELMVHMIADAKESHKLLSLQINEQKRLRDSLDLRIKSGHPLLPTGSDD